MEVILGKDVLIEFFKGSGYSKFVCADNIEFTPTMKIKSVKTLGDGINESYRGQSIGYTVSVTGLIAYDEPDYVNAFDLLEYNRQMVDIPFRILFMKQDGSQYTQIRGRGLVVDCPITGPADFAGCSINIQGSGPYEIGVPPSCNVTITKAVLMTGELGKKKIVVLGTSAPVGRYDYKVIANSGGEFTGTSLSPTWEFFMPEEGVINIMATCDNGISGPVYSLQINDGNITGPCDAVIIDAEVSQEGDQRRVNIIDQSGAASYSYEYIGEMGTISGTANTDTFDIADQGVGLIKITPLCESGLSGEVFELNVYNDLPEAEIKQVGVSLVSGQRTVNIYDAPNAVKFDWAYTPTGEDPILGTSLTNTWQFEDAGLGTLTITPFAADDSPGAVVNLPLTTGQSTSCAAEIINASYEDGDFGFGTERRYSIEELASVPAVKYDHEFFTSDPAYPGSYTGTATSTNQFSSPAVTYGVLRVIPYCDLSNKGVTYYLIIK